MTNPSPLTLAGFFLASIQKYAALPATGFVDTPTVTYQEWGHQVEILITRFKELGIQPGDKIALLSHNVPNWGISYFAITVMGAVAVPVLPDFSEVETHNVLEHSESVALLVSSRLQYKLGDSLPSAIRLVFNMDDFTLISSGGEKRADSNLTSIPAIDYTPKEEDLAAIIYTSGTTGKQKGVMLSHRNLCTNTIMANKVQPIASDDIFLSLLPLSHVYECTLGLILPVYSGASVQYLSGPLSPQEMLEALKTVRPTILLTVPLIIEKIFRNRILPKIQEKTLVRVLYKLPAFRRLVHKGAGKKLMATFGGRLRFFGVGGAKLDAVVEQFLLDARFPVAIGYGLTETSPMLAGTNPRTARLQSTGPPAEGVELRLDDHNGTLLHGEIWARGSNVMMGYYKDPELTREVITEDGWFKTGDLGSFDEDGFLSILGRVKNTILGSNGENIYPEEIESMINNYRHVLESIVIEQKGKLVALVHFNKEEIERTYQHLSSDITEYVDRKTEELQKELQEYINARVSRFARLHEVVLQPIPFQKTATQKIKRYLYY